MNLSGNSIAKVKNFYKIDDVVVIHDDLDLPFGTLRFKKGGGDGGHNGLKSTDEKISREYIRVRMGIGKPEHKGEIISHVLGDFSEDEQKYLGMWIDKTCDAIEFLLENSLEDTSSRYSIKKFQLQ
jgi:PTH1 family peptidyl-tRNA hydrolase